MNLESFGSLLVTSLVTLLLYQKVLIKIFEKLMVNLSEIFLGGMMLEVKSGVWV